MDRLSFSKIAITVIILTVGCSNQQSQDKKVKDIKESATNTKIQYKPGMPTEATAKKMFDELAYQRAVQVYLWGTACCGHAQMRDEIDVLCLLFPRFTFYKPNSP
jgi:hypothetical protein